MKQTQHKLKDKKAMIYKNTKINNAGDWSMKWQPISASPLWCFTQNLSGSILYNPLVIENEETRQFVFNYLPNIEQGYYILYRDKWYEVTRVNSTADYNDEIFVYVKNVFSNPSQNDILSFE